MGEVTNTTGEQQHIEQQTASTQDFVFDAKIQYLTKTLQIDTKDDKTLKDIQEASTDFQLPAFKKFIDDIANDPDMKGVDKTILLKALQDYTINASLEGNLIPGELKTYVKLNNAKQNEQIIKLENDKQNAQIDAKIINKEKVIEKCLQFLSNLTLDQQKVDVFKQSKKIDEKGLETQLANAPTKIRLEDYIKLQYLVENNDPDTQVLRANFQKETGIDAMTFLSQINTEASLQNISITESTIDAQAFAKQTPDRDFDGVVTKSNDTNRKAEGFDNVFSTFEKDFFTKDSQLNTTLDKAVTSHFDITQPGFESISSKNVINYQSITKEQLRMIFSGIVPPVTLESALDGYWKYIQQVKENPDAKDKTKEAILDTIIKRKFLQETQPLVKKIVAEKYFSQVADLLKVGGQQVSMNTDTKAIQYKPDGSIDINYHTDNGMKGLLTIAHDGTVQITDMRAKRGDTDTQDNEYVIQSRQRTLAGKLVSIDTMIDTASQHKDLFIDAWSTAAQNNRIDTIGYATAIDAKKNALTTIDTSTLTSKNILNASLQHSLEMTKAFDTTVSYLAPLTNGNDAMSKYYNSGQGFLDRQRFPESEQLFVLRETFASMDTAKIQHFMQSMKGLTDVYMSKKAGENPLMVDASRTLAFLSYFIQPQQIGGFQVESFTQIADQITREKPLNINQWFLQDESRIGILPLQNPIRRTLENQFDEGSSESYIESKMNEIG